MALAILLPLGAGEQLRLDIVVDHGGGEDLPLPKGNELAAHVGDDLVHVEADVGKVVPFHGPLTFQALFQVPQFLHASFPPFNAFDRIIWF